MIDGTLSCLELEAVEWQLEVSMHDEQVWEEETIEDVAEDCMIDDLLLYVKSLLLIVVALHQLMSVLEMPDLLPGLCKEYGMSTPSYLGKTGVTLLSSCVAAQWTPSVTVLLLLEDSVRE